MTNAGHKIYLLNGFAIAVGRGGIPQNDGSFQEQPELAGQYLALVFQQSRKLGFTPSGKDITSLPDKSAFDKYMSKQKQSIKCPQSIEPATEEQARAFFGQDVFVQTIR